MQTLLLDLDGVLYQDDHVIDGAVETLRWCKRRNIPHLFVTNTSSRPRRALVERLSSMGLSVSDQQIFAPPVAARDYLVANDATPLALFVRKATREDFEGLELLDDAAEQGAGSVVIGDIGEAWDFAALNRAFRLLMAEPRPLLIALGMSRYAQGSDGLVLDVAPFIKALEHASGCEAVVMGKPATEFFDAAVRKLGASPAQTVMIGDDIVGDVGGAQATGLTGILVRTGKFRPRDLEGDIRPDAVLDSVADLPQWWENRDS
ncbi:MAG: TIGR01458 family HAD-type hydrolase [Deltaproteobacteria bacterium]|nr:MAG: TIGR01458 family HAD-type hydrolase [Deltaproteobacteria bacterium]